MGPIQAQKRTAVFHPDERALKRVKHAPSPVPVGTAVPDTVTFGDLPADALRKTFVFLSERERAQVACVSTEFKAAAYRDDEKKQQRAAQFLHIALTKQMRRKMAPELKPWGRYLLERKTSTHLSASYFGEFLQRMMPEAMSPTMSALQRLLGYFVRQQPSASLSAASRVHAILQLQDPQQIWEAIFAMHDSAHSLEPELQQDLVNLVLTLAPEYRGTLIACLGLSSHAFAPELQQQLVNAALELEDSEHRGVALFSLGKSSHAFVSQLQRRVVNATLELADPKYRGFAIVTLAISSHAFAPELQQRLVDAALELADPEHRGFAIGSLGRSSHAFAPELQQRLVDAALELADPEHRGFAIGSLGLSSHAFAPELQQRLADGALELAELQNRSIAIYGLGQSSHAFAPELQKRLVDAALKLAFPQNRNIAIRGLGKSVYAFTPELQVAYYRAVQGLSYNAHAETLHQIYRPCHY